MELSKSTRAVRIAVAEGSGPACPPLGRALRFAIFDVDHGQVRGPVYRIRHDNPGETCDHHAELVALLHDCQCVIAGSVGPHLGHRLRSEGLEVLATSDAGSSLNLVTNMLAGKVTLLPDTKAPLNPAQ